MFRALRFTTTEHFRSIIQRSLRFFRQSSFGSTYISTCIYRFIMCADKVQLGDIYPETIAISITPYFQESRGVETIGLKSGLFASVIDSWWLNFGFIENV